MTAKNSSIVNGLLDRKTSDHRSAAHARARSRHHINRDSPQITVITPAYNVEKYIGEAIDSVLAQSFTRFEYLVIDDGSTDATAEEVRKRAETDPRVRLVTTEHGGACNARNVGIELSRGRFIAFLDGDDRWHPDFLAYQLAALESAGPEVAAVFARSRVMSENGRVYTVRWQRSGRYDFDDMFLDHCPPRSGSSLLIKKQAFGSAGLFDVKLCSAQDFDMWLRILSESGMPYFLGTRRYLVDIRIRPGAISRDYKQRFAALETVIGGHCSKLRRNPEGMGYVRAAVFAFRAGEDDVAVRWARLAVKGNLSRLLVYPYGWRLLGWGSLGARQRRTLRRANASFRALAGRVVGVRGSVLR